MAHEVQKIYIYIPENKTKTQVQDIGVTSMAQMNTVPNIHGSFFSFITFLLFFFKLCFFFPPSLLHLASVTFWAKCVGLNTSLFALIWTRLTNKNAVVKTQLDLKKKKKSLNCENISLSHSWVWHLCFSSQQKHFIQQNEGPVNAAETGLVMHSEKEFLSVCLQSSIVYHNLFFAT